MKKFSSLLLAAIIGSISTLWVYNNYIKEDQQVVIRETVPSMNATNAYNNLTSGGTKNIDFVDAAENTVEAVVHITSKKTVRSSYNQMYDPFFRFFGDDFYQQQPREEVQQGSGSGVILSNDGYIVTNNHVIAGADELEVILNNQETYPAKVIGTDAATDIALIKIEAEGLKSIQFENSDKVKVGEWVLAVGNPFNLASTVTAGIVSAKSRSINILRDKSSRAIESFIQTDAAVNPGNSGGALVNQYGRLIGINTAIASPTGSYAGYAFAVPSNIVKKVVADLREYGIVQRAYMGVMIHDVNNKVVEEHNLKSTSGVFVSDIVPESAAEEAGIKKDDVIVEFDGMKVNSTPQLLEKVSTHRPGDAVNLKVVRNGKEKEFVVTLKNEDGNMDVVKKEDTKVDLLGAEFGNYKDKSLSYYQQKSAVQIKKLLDGKLKNETNISEGFVILRINNQTVENVSDLKEVIKNAKGGVMIEGMYPNRRGRYYYAFGLN